MPRREVLRPEDAKTLAGRKLRELALTQTYAAIAKRARADETSVRRWAKEEATPTPDMRGRLKETLGFDASWWATPNDPDVYVTDPATKKDASFSRSTPPVDAQIIPTRPR